MIKLVQHYSVVFAAMTVVGGVYMFYLGVRQTRRRRSIEDTATSLIGQAASGFVEFHGKARANHNPFFIAADGTPCLYARVVISEWVRGSKRSKWVVRYRYTVGERILLEDASGVAEVVMEGADLDVAKSSTFWETVSPQRREAYLLNSAGHPNSPSWVEMSSGDWEIFEERVPADCELLVQGHFEKANDGPEVFVRTAEEPLAESRMKSKGTVRTTPVHRLMVAKDTEKDILKRLRFGGWMMVLGPVSTAIGVWIYAWVFCTNYRC